MFSSVTRSLTKRTPFAVHCAQLLLLALEIDHGDVRRRHLDELEEDGQRAFGDGAVADEEDLVAEFGHETRVRLRLREDGGGDKRGQVKEAFQRGCKKERDPGGPQAADVHPNIAGGPGAGAAPGGP
jgi:hypothetical protein